MIAPSIICPARAAVRPGGVGLNINCVNVRDIGIAAANDAFVKRRSPINLPIGLFLLPLALAILSTILVSLPGFGKQDLYSKSMTENMALLLIIQHTVFWFSASCSFFMSCLFVGRLMKESWTYVRILAASVMILTVIILVSFLDESRATRKWDYIFAAQSTTIGCWIDLTVLYLMILFGDEIQGRLGYVTGARTWWRKSLEEIIKTRKAEKDSRKANSEAV